MTLTGRQGRRTGGSSLRSALGLAVCLVGGCGAPTSRSISTRIESQPGSPDPREVALHEWMQKHDLQRVTPHLTPIPPAKGTYYGFILFGYEYNVVMVHPREDGRYVVAFRHTSCTEASARKHEATERDGALAFADGPRLYFYREQHTGTVLVSRGPLPADPEPATVKRGRQDSGVYYLFEERTAIDESTPPWQLTDLWTDLTAQEQQQWMAWQPAAADVAPWRDDVRDVLDPPPWLGAWKEHPSAHVELRFLLDQYCTATSGTRQARYTCAASREPGAVLRYRLTRSRGDAILPDGVYEWLSTPAGTYLVAAAFAATSPTPAQLLAAVRDRHDVFRRFPR